MKAITLWQPWASLVVAGVKQYETRSWPTSFRGPLAIHAARLDCDELVRELSHDLRTIEDLATITYERLNKAVSELPRGAILGTVEVLGCYPITADTGRLSDTERALGDYTPGRYAWKLANPVRLHKPIPCRGHQGLWNWQEAAA